MKYVVVDTDVVSNLSQGRSPNPLAELLVGAIPIISFTTVAELHYGAAKGNWGQRKLNELDQMIRRFLIAPYDEDLAKLWGRLRNQARLSGHPLAQAIHANDLWICATAIRHDAPLLTLNRRHFEHFPGLSLL